MEFSGRIVEILQSADLNVITAKSIRRQLESEFHIDLNDRKREIDSLIVSLLPSASTHMAGARSKVPDQSTGLSVSSDSIDQLAEPDSKRRISGTSFSKNRSRRNDTAKISNEMVYDSDDEVDDDHDVAVQLHRDLNNTRKSSSSRRRVTTGRKRASEQKPGNADKEKKPNNGFNKPLLLSPVLSALFGGAFEKMSRPEVVKAIWQYIKQHSLQDPKDRRFILCDDLLRPVMGGKQRVSSFGMNRYIGEHLYRLEDIVGTTDKDSAPTEKAQTEKKSQTGSKSSSRPKSSGGSGFMKLLTLSPALSAVLGGAKEMARPMVVKHLWGYIKSKSLQDPNDKRQILCDDLLRAVMGGRSRVSAFEMNRYLSSHLGTKTELLLSESEDEDKKDIPNNGEDAEDPESDHGDNIPHSVADLSHQVKTL